MIGALAALAAAWVALLVAAPWLPALFGAVVYGLGSVICHQIPERSFHLAGFQLPVCARCLGIYSGVLPGVAAYVFLGASRGVRSMGRLVGARRLAVLAATPTVLTLALEAADVWAPSNETRALAGVPLGAVVGLVVVSALATLHYGECVPPRPIVPKPPPPST